METKQVARFTALWTKAQTSVFAVIASTVTNFSDAEDLLQRVSVVAVSKFDQFHGEEDSDQFVAWTIMIARYEILKHLRDKATDRHQYIADSVDVIADAFKNVALEYDDRRGALDQCLQLLKGRSRKVLEKRYGEGIKTAEIANQLGISPGNVSVILNRAYRKLRACVDQRIASSGGGA